MLRCPACGGTDNIAYTLRHQLVHVYDTNTIPNVITLKHNDEQCGYSQTYWLEECLEDIFPFWVGGPRPEPRNQGILTREQLEQMGFQVAGDNEVVIPTDRDGNAEVQLEENPDQMQLFDSDLVETDYEELKTNSEEE